jgi:uroporphyrinogen decarboxylase
MNRRQFLGAAFAGAAFGQSQLDRKSRVDRALKGTEVDRPPFTLWHHFGLKTPEEHAKATLDFHRKYRTDLVKVMSDFPYPRGSGKWYELKVQQDPFAPQVQALKLIRDGLDQRAYFIETIFNSWNVAEKLSSKEDVLKLKSEKPQALLDALDVITQSQINHAKKALATGAAGIFLAVANANSKSLAKEDYVRFSLPFDKKILEAVSGAKLNVLHLHVDREYLDLFRSVPAAVVNYSAHVTGIPLEDARKLYSSVIMGGIDERDYRNLTEAQIESQWKSAQRAVGSKFILSPGCSVPNESTGEELSRLPKVLNA